MNPFFLCHHVAGAYHPIHPAGEPIALRCQRDIFERNGLALAQPKPLPQATTAQDEHEAQEQPKQCNASDPRIRKKGPSKDGLRGSAVHRCTPSNRPSDG